MEKRDYYEVLGIERNADAATVKSAYRRSAMQFHPDRNPGDHQAEERFKEAAEAYEVLSNPDRRALYDQYGHNGPRQAGFEGFAGMDDIFSHFADFFGDSFGGTFTGRRQQRKGTRVDIKLSLLEVMKGAKKEVRVQRQVACDSCGGNGAKRGSQPVPCGMCGGRGQVLQAMGFMRIASTCPTCRGQGKVIRDKCDECRGGGTVRRQQTLTVDVPAGVDDGRVMQASVGSGDPIFLQFSVEPDPRFEREGDDLFTDVAVSFSQATLGASVGIPMVDGETDLEVPPGTQPGAMFTLKGQGVPHLETRGRGDLHVRFNVKVPRKLSTEHRRLIEQLADLERALSDDEHADGSAGKDDEGGFFRRKKKRK